MKCSACQVEIEENIKAHYASEVHKINVKRQIYNAPPITIEEINGEQLSDDVSLEINGLETGEKCSSSKKYSRKRNSSKVVGCSPEAVCLFCEFPESNTHYRDHGLSDEEVAYIDNKVCYMCYEAFSERESLRRHISSGNHRNAMTDGVNLILESGKVIQGRGRNRSREEEPRRPESRERNMIVRSQAKEDRRAIIKNKNRLKISLSMNFQPRFKPDWMQ
ncbi:uncharacterized protein Eint_100280 [Encephalitozoon intestinalis ATCC 50506]|uniref:C2H2-type domain-containing protein n=1 Tax=Encephalitozoon intestinalis (strain ATCC 50506) TaxID=876142 RepID=E0S9H0_ENCIT|nr:uncharacterized protein Eint_100280 [Encephalitozoon intestinalis ATCC 50506]ADM12355.1 hypothetical protein Eint_100280 [Encephalitozoon intestinalis ATCC 50506]UTX46185.1 hypothetical protein GPK93_10g17820 [Encephalitozoon intestinalis]